MLAVTAGKRHLGYLRSSGKSLARVSCHVEFFLGFFFIGSMVGDRIWHLIGWPRDPGSYIDASTPPWHPAAVYRFPICPVRIVGSFMARSGSRWYSSPLSAAREPMHEWEVLPASGRVEVTTWEINAGPEPLGVSADFARRPPFEPGQAGNWRCSRLWDCAVVEPG